MNCNHDHPTLRVNDCCLKVYPCKPQAGIQLYLQRHELGNSTIVLMLEPISIPMQAGIQLYLQRHALGNSTMPDAVRAIGEALLTRGAQVLMLPEH